MIRPLAFVCAFIPSVAVAGTAWDDVRAMLYGESSLTPAGPELVIDAPYRTDTDSRTLLGTEFRAPQDTSVTALTLVIDENPMPVSAVVRFAEPQRSARFAATMRLNGPTPVHVVAEMTSGEAFVAETFVKTSGEGACAAPPGSDLQTALETLGDMELSFSAAVAGPQATAAERLTSLGRHDVDVTISHPSNSGLQRDQISLLYIPMRYVSEVAVVADDRPYATITGSISLSENPRIVLSLPAGTTNVMVTMTDTEGATTTAEASISGS